MTTGDEKIYLPSTDQELPRHLTMGFQRYAKFKNFEDGGVANLRECVDQNLGRRVLMKSLHPHLSDKPLEQGRFLREARVTAQLEHPATVPVYELGRDCEGHLYFTMKEVEGVTLRNILEKLADQHSEFNDTYPLDQRLEIFIQVCQAVAYAHSQGVIHRDLKPANVLIGEFGEVMVLDWGLAKVFNEPDEFVDPLAPVDEHPSTTDLGLTRNGKRYGTPLYMSPEQALGQSDVDERCDIYLLGSVLYEILTLKTLIWGRDMEEVLSRIIQAEHLSPIQKSPGLKIPPELDAICMKSLSKQPEDRYESVADLVADIRRFRRDQAVSVYKDGVLRSFLKWRHRHILSTRAILSFLLGVLLTILYVTWLDG